MGSDRSMVDKGVSAGCFPCGDVAGTAVPLFSGVLWGALDFILPMSSPGLPRRG